MTSRADTLKIARADMVIVGSKIADAQQGRVFGHSAPKIAVRDAVRMMEQTARRLRTSFGLHEDLR